MSLLNRGNSTTQSTNTTATAQSAALLDLDALMEETLTEVEEAPDYVTPGTGAYSIVIPEVKLETFTMKAKDNQPEQQAVRIRLTYGIMETLELDQSATPVPDGSLFSETFTFNEQGKSIFKKQARKLLNVESVDDVPLKELFAELMSQEPFIAIVTSKDKNGYTNVRVDRHVEE